jgi:hypothetical protein
VLLLFSLGFFIWSGVVGVQAIRFIEIGQTAAGRVTDCIIGSKGGVTCHYDFKVNGQTHSGQESEMLGAGSQLQVYYFAGDPDNNALDQPNWFPAGLVTLVLGIFCGIAGYRSFMSTDELMDD